MTTVSLRGFARSPAHVSPPRSTRTPDPLARFARLAAVGQSSEALFLEMVDLLSAVQGHCDLARQGDEDAIAEARRLALRCADRVRMLLSFTRGNTQRWSCNLQNVVARVRSHLTLFALDDFPLDVDLEDHARIACPPTQLQQVLQHLILFARESIGRGVGRVEVHARTRHRHVTLEIRHDGPGIPRAMRKRLFQPFAAPEAGALGLELYVARRIVEAHGGVLGLFSHPERGTTFRVVMPLAG